MHFRVGNNIPPLTGIRGLAALWVWLYHAWLVAGNRPIKIESIGINLTPIFSQGWVGVDLFFVLSGCVLAWPFLGQKSREFSFSDFMRRRALRVIPAYYLQFFLLLCAGSVGFIWDLPSLSGAFFHLALSHNWKESWAFYEPWWTLPVEWYFYLTFPLLLALAARRPLWALFALLAIAVAWRTSCFFWLDAADPETPIGTRVWLMHQLPGRIDQFFIGIGVALGAHRFRERYSTTYRSWLSDILLCTTAVLLVLWLYVLAWNYEGYWKGVGGLAFYWNSIAALLLGFLVLSLSLEGKLARALFANRLMLWLGEISYSIYLWHFAVLVALVHFQVFASVNPSFIFLSVIALSLPTMLFVAAVSWRVAEHPFLAYRQLTAEDNGLLARVISKPWPYIALIAVLMIGFLLGVRNYWTPSSAYREDCSQRGALDTPTKLDFSSPIATFAGWAYDWNPQDRLRRIVIIFGGTEVAATTPSLERTDVVQALPYCRVGKPGFSVPVDVRRVQVDETGLVVMAEHRSGKRYEIGRATVGFEAPIFAIDTAPSPILNGKNLISGWSWHPSGPVKIRWRSATQILYETNADRPRSDVAEAYPAWSAARLSGFEFDPVMAKLPRGEYDTFFEFTNSQGVVATAPGPKVKNDKPFGKVIARTSQHFSSVDAVEIDAWVASEHGIAEARIVSEAGGFITGMKHVKKDVPLSSLRDSRFPGETEKTGQKSSVRGVLLYGVARTNALLPGIHRLGVQITDKKGGQTFLPGPLVLRGESSVQTACSGERFRVYLLADMGFIRRGIPLLGALRKLGESGCVEFGLQMRVEYLRTTLGKDKDFAFTPDFPEHLRYFEGREMLGVSLQTALEQAEKYRIPARITLDGGVWADSRFPLPDYDIADWLEEDDSNVQWNQHGHAERDDALGGLAGATENPQLARMLGLGYYNEPFRSYKRRNLQAAVRLIAAYNKQHPDRPVSVNLDPDQYINPWFYQTQWYDYNPRTVRQFREWLTHTGVYAEGRELAQYRPTKRMGLQQINAMARRAWLSVEDIEPPRGYPNYDDPWHQKWTSFKRHLVARHYDDLARWATDAGLAPELVYTSQTFIQADVAHSENDHASGWTDEAGVSIAGAKPENGHLGAILYGPASRNEGTSRKGKSLLDSIAQTDPRWAVVEMHPATIAHPMTIPSHADSYQTISSIYNYGAGSISLMWGSWAGDQEVHPESFRAYDVLEQSPWETQLFLWLREVSDLPLGSRHWPFGSRMNASDDGFVPLPGSEIKKVHGAITVRSRSDSGTASAGIRREDLNWKIVRNSNIRIVSSGSVDGICRLNFHDRPAAKVAFTTTRENEQICDLSEFSESKLQAFELVIANRSATLDSVSLVQGR